MAVSRRFLQMGILLCAVSLGYMLLLTNIVMPLFSEDISRRFMVEQFGQFIDNQEASTLEVLLAILRNPIQLFEELVNPPDRTIRYLLAQWVPLAFVPVISVDAWLLAGFPTLKILMQHDPVALSMHLRYAVTLVPGLFYGTILWWAKHPQRFQPRTARIWLICIGIALFFTLTSNPNRSLSFVIPDSVQPWVYISPGQQWQHAQAVRSLLRQIPADASVTAPPQLINHLSSRREALRFPGTQLVNDAQQIIQVEYAVVDMWYPLRFSPAFKGEGRALINMQAQVKEWLDQKAYGLIDFQDGVALLQLERPSNPTAIANWEAFQTTTQHLSPPSQD